MNSSPTLQPAGVSGSNETENACKRSLSLHEALVSACAIEKVTIDKLYPLVDKLRSRPDENVVVSSFSVKESNQTRRWDLDLSFRSPKAFSMWRACLTAAFHKFEIQDSYLSSRSSSWKSILISATLLLSEMKKVLEFLKPLSNRSLFEYVQFRERESSIEIMQAIISFFDTASVTLLEIFPSTHREEKGKSEDVDFTPLVTVVREMCPSAVRYDRNKPISELTDFLLQIAQLTDTIYLCTINEKDDESISISIIKQILSRKCRNLQVADTFTKVSREQIVELVQYFQEMGKEVSLAISAEIPIEKEIGLYRLTNQSYNMYTHEKDLLLIEHTQMFPRTKDQIAKHLERSTEPTSNYGNRRLNSDQTAEKCEANELATLFENECELVFHFCDSREQSLWAAYLIGAFATIGIPEYTVTKRTEVGWQFTYHIVAWTYKFSNLGQRREAAQCLRHLAARTTYNWAKFEIICPEVIAMCSDILAPSSVKVVRITTFELNKMEVEEYDPLLRMIRTVCPTMIDCNRFQLSHGAFNPRNWQLSGWCISF